MNAKPLPRLLAEWQRLYLPRSTPSASAEGSSTDPAPASEPAFEPASGPEALPADACRTRGASLELASPPDWPRLSAVWHGVQADLGLPEPAIAVSGEDGHQLWFSWREPIPTAEATAFLDALRRRYLGEVPAHRVRARIAPESPCVPAPCPATGGWSAFVQPGLAAVFADDPWLDTEPNPVAQADVLSRVGSITPAAFDAALLMLGMRGSSSASTSSSTSPWPRPAPSPSLPPAPSMASPGSRKRVEAPSPRVEGLARAEGSAFDDLAFESEAPGQTCPHADAARGDPEAFLQSVMNDPQTPLALRIKAAKALLRAGRAPG